VSTGLPVDDGSANRRSPRGGSHHCPGAQGGHIHPPVDDAPKILVPAYRVYIELPLFPRDEEKAAAEA